MRESRRKSAAYGPARRRKLLVDGSRVPATRWRPRWGNSQPAIPSSQQSHRVSVLLLGFLLFRFLAGIGLGPVQAALDAFQKALHGKWLANVIHHAQVLSVRLVP